MSKRFVLMGSRGKKWHELDSTGIELGETADNAKSFLRSIAWVWKSEGYENLTVVSAKAATRLARTKPWEKSDESLEDEIRQMGWFLNRCEDGTFQIKEWHGDPDESGPFNSILEALEYARENPIRRQSSPSI